MNNKLDQNISLESILNEIGFQRSELGLQFDFGNCVLKVVVGVNEYFQSGFNFFGNFFTTRTSKTFIFFLPEEVASYEQGIALIAYYLRNTAFQIKPQWLSDGLALNHYLPWKIESKAYDERPVAIIESEWFRVLVNKIQLSISASSDEDVTVFSFDGTILKVVCNLETFVISGEGKHWGRTATIKTKSLNFLPKRIQKGSVMIFIWEGILYVGNRRFEIYSESQDSNDDRV